MKTRIEDIYADRLDMRGVTDAASGTEAALARLRSILAGNLETACRAAERAYRLRHKTDAVYTYSIDIEHCVRSSEDSVQTTVWFCTSVSPAERAEDGWRPSAEVASAFVDLSRDGASALTGKMAAVVRGTLSAESVRLAKEQVRYMLAALDDGAADGNGNEKLNEDGKDRN